MRKESSGWRLLLIRKHFGFRETSRADGAIILVDSSRNIWIRLSMLQPATDQRTVSVNGSLQ